LKNAQLITGGHKTLGAKWLGEHYLSQQAFFSVDRKVAPNSPNDFIPPAVTHIFLKFAVLKYFSTFTVIFIETGEKILIC